MALYNAASTANHRDYANSALFNQIANQTGHTLSAWVHPNITPVAQWAYIARGAGLVAGEFTLGTPSSSSFNLTRAQIITASGSQTVADTLTFTNNVWQHVCQTWDGTNLKVYVNGRLRNTSTPAGTFTQSSTNDVRLWMRTDGTVGTTDAYIEQFGWWRVALSAAEVDALACGGDFTKIRRDDAIILDKLDSINGVDIVSGLGTNTGTITVKEPCPILRPHLGQFWTQQTQNRGSGRTRRKYLQGVTAAAAPTLAWGPELPDLPPAAAPRPNAGPAVAYVPAADRWGLDAIPWLPTYPERARALPEPNRGPAVAYSPAIDRWGLDGGKTPWRGVFPDRVPGPARANVGPASAAGQAVFGVEGGQQGWNAVFPDRVPPALRPNSGPTFAAGQAIHGVEGGQRAGWIPTFADRVPAPPRAPDLPAIAYVPAISRWGLDTLAWLPLFPGRIPSAQRVVDAGFSALVQLVAPAITLGWYPSFPDAAPGRAPPREYPQPAYTPAINRWGLDGVPWLPSYPERVPAAARPNAGPSFAGPTSPPALPFWFPAFPDSAPGPRRAAEYQALAQTLLNVIAPPAPLGSWYPAYPDFARAAAPRPSGGPAQTLQHVVPLASWYPSFPDSVRAAARAQNTDPGQLLRTLAAIVNIDSWAPQYPDRIWAPRQPVPAGAAFVNLGSATPPPRGVSATYPDRTAPPARMPPTEFAEPLFPPSFAPPLSWQGTFPPAVPGHRPRPAGGPTAPADPTPPPLSWAARFVDRIQPPRGAPAGHFSFVQLLVAPVPLLSWLSIFPEMVRGPVPRHVLAGIIRAAPFPPPSTIVEILFGPPSVQIVGPSRTEANVESSATLVVLTPYDE